MLPKKQRPRARDIASLRRGSVVRTGLFFARIAPATSEKIGFTVPKKVAGSAVDRNRMRRQLYESARTIVRERSGRTPRIVLISLLKPLSHTPEMIRAELRTLFEKIGV